VFYTLFRSVYKFKSYFFQSSIYPGTGPFASLEDTLHLLLFSAMVSFGRLSQCLCKLRSYSDQTVRVSNNDVSGVNNDSSKASGLSVAAHDLSAQSTAHAAFVCQNDHISRLGHIQGFVEQK